MHQMQANARRTQRQHLHLSHEPRKHQSVAYPAASPGSPRHHPASRGRAVGPLCAFTGKQVERGRCRPRCRAQVCVYLYQAWGSSSGAMQVTLGRNKTWGVSVGAGLGAGPPGLPGSPCRKRLSGPLSTQNWPRLAFPWAVMARPPYLERITPATPAVRPPSPAITDCPN